MTNEFACPVTVGFPKPGSSLQCDCKVSSESISFSAAQAKPIPLTTSLYLDEFGQTNGFAIWNDDGIQAVISSNPDNQLNLMNAIIDHLWEPIGRVSSEPIDQMEWRHSVHRGSLHSACVLGDKERFEKLISEMASFSVDRQDSSGRTALYYACSRDFKHGVESLVKAGADPAYGDNEGVTPLHVSSRLGHANTTQFLLTSGTGVIVAEFEGDQTSPVWLAACSNNPRAAACLKALLAHGFSADLTYEGKHLLHVACIQNQTEVVETLLVEGKLDPNIISSEGLGPLHYAVRENATNEPTLVKDLLWAGAYANYPTDDDLKNTPLHLCRQEDVAMALVQHGARLDILNASGQAATYHLSEDFVKRLSSTSLVRWKLKREVAILFCPNAAYLDGSTCRLCKYAFLPLIGRKHHCRICGSLVCESCSLKRVTFSSQAYRACDGCFNRAIEAKVAFQMLPNAIPAVPDSPPGELLDSPELSPTSRPAALDLSDNETAIARPIAALQERSQALDELGNRSDALRNDAEQFASLADKLAAKFGAK